MKAQDNRLIIELSYHAARFVITVQSRLTVVISNCGHILTIIYVVHFVVCLLFLGLNIKFKPLKH